METDELEFLLEDETIVQIDWESVDFCEADRGRDPSFGFVVGGGGGVSPAPCSSASDASPSATATSWISEIENLLMKDDDDGGDAPHNHESYYGFLSDVLPDFPAQSSPSSPHQELVDRSSTDDKNSTSSSSDKPGLIQAQLLNNKSLDPNHDDAVADDNDPISKKLRRQLRNRDAAVRSRERKRMYTKDLEMKSRYLEAECRRLGRLLQCCYAENQMLRVSVQGGSVFDAPIAKQESAVLLLESLLLGSLLWFLGIMCVLPLPRLLQLKSNLGAALPRNIDKVRQGSVAPRGTGSELFNLWMSQCPFKSKRCKASRRKIKSISLAEWFD
ncbi:hypothetical protein Dimus_034542 [Dionaea muscipula]